MNIKGVQQVQGIGSKSFTLKKSEITKLYDCALIFKILSSTSNASVF